MFLSDQQVADRFAVSRVTVWRWTRHNPAFPRPVKLSPGCSRWRLADIERWEVERAAA